MCTGTILKSLLAQDPTCISFYAPIFLLLTGQNLLKLGQQVHAQMALRGLEPNAFLGAKMVAMCGAMNLSHPRRWWHVEPSTTNGPMELLKSTQWVCLEWPQTKALSLPHPNHPIYVTPLCRWRVTVSHFTTREIQSHNHFPNVKHHIHCNPTKPSGTPSHRDVRSN
ncbi:hypothetical protein ACE6H2_009012 [Prunus campanulata]